jgi:hypothetical protein
METVKVDFQKLQMLNDRIAQTIDALNQVRLTTHGLQHSGPMQQQGAAGLGGVQGSVQGYGQNYVQPGQYPQQIAPQMGALQHASPIPQQLAPQGQWPLPFQAPVGATGIAHSMPQIDPYWSMRAAQAFPFAAYQYSPSAF